MSDDVFSADLIRELTTRGWLVEIDIHRGRIRAVKDRHNFTFSRRDELHAFIAGYVVGRTEQAE